MKRLVLVGGGHAHVHVLERWRASPVPGVQLVVVCEESQAPYSGMVPGWLAGHYRFDEITIDIASLAQRAGAQFIASDVQSMNAAARTLTLGGTASPPVLDYDIVSLNVGSTLHPPTDLAGVVLSMRPLSQLRAKWDALLQGLATEASAGAHGDPQGRAPVRRVVVAGGGPAGVEALLAALSGLRRALPKVPWQGLLLTRDAQVLSHHGATARAHMLDALHRAEVQVQANVDANTYPFKDTDIVLWATGAQAHPWLARSGLAVDDAGFVSVNDRLQSTSHAHVHAAGDCCAFAPPQPKAGVTAVRMGPVLATNLQAALRGGLPTRFEPPPRQLALLSTVDGRAVASWGGLSVQGRWVWRAKDRIDRRFVRRFNVGGIAE
jgi:pyridine nucleotide-disulfide oxidoreductase family protein